MLFRWNKNFFFSFLRAIIYWKNKNLIKNSGHKVKLFNQDSLHAVQPLQGMELQENKRSRWNLFGKTVFGQRLFYLIRIPSTQYSHYKVWSYKKKKRSRWNLFGTLFWSSGPTPKVILVLLLLEYFNWVGIVILDTYVGRSCLG